MNRKYFRYVSTFFVVVPMTFIMALVGIGRNYGFVDGWVSKFFGVWTTMLPIAYVAAFLIIPQALRLTEMVMKKESASNRG
ncbi:Protein of unknown function [Flexibacter flexilis DSM 6793]|uniref:DUF2798 domain-containing protein n=1 Tax=Flexibacter flexilis DSM 6793 TaxID=927664 RepID=A0A1I1KRT1_9BACT|nr:DUF2798 domain-containing protein [Flexibacter flexilis]SFC63441.1 Protein of unknown function [Flexibacter flexilis DSM 6793]